MQQPLQCVKGAFSECSSVDNPMIQSLNKQLSLAEDAFDLVCVKEIDSKFVFSVFSSLYTNLTVSLNSSM